MRLSFSYYTNYLPICKNKKCYSDKLIIELREYIATILIFDKSDKGHLLAHLRSHSHRSLRDIFAVYKSYS